VVKARMSGAEGGAMAEFGVATEAELEWESALETDSADRAPAHLLRVLARKSSDLIAVLNDRAELVYANPAGQRILGFAPAGEVGGSIFDLVHPADRAIAAAAFTRDISEPGVHSPAIYRVRTRAGGWRFIEVVATNCLDDPAVRGIVVNGRDVTESTKLTKALRTIGQSNHALVHAADEGSLLAATCSTIAHTGGYPLAWVGYAENDERCSVRPVAWAGNVEYLQSIHVSWADDEYGRGPIGTAIRSRTIQTAHDLARTDAYPADRRAATRCGLHTNCVVPLRVGGEVIGVLSIYGNEPRIFGASEVRLFSELGEALAYGIGRTRDATLLRASEERFRTLAGAAPIGILEVTPRASVVYANQALAEITGRDVASLMGLGWIDAVHADDLADLRTAIERIRPTRSTMATRFRIRRPSGEIRHVGVSAAPKGGDENDGYVVTVDDVTDEVTAQQALTHQAFYDTLTGLPNRALFIDRLSLELARCRRDGSSIAVLLLDLDRFKIVNDSLGHDTGDAVLEAVGARFLLASRAGDTVARFSGDEFMFIIRNVNVTEDAVAAAHRLLAVLDAPIQCAGQVLTVTASVGIVMPAPHADAVAVLRDADTAMYQAKEGGRNRYEVFDENLHRRSVARLTIEGELRQALARHEFEVYYQPSVDAATGRPVGAEALVRWHHPERGLVPPLEFIPVAEDSGLIKPMGRWVFEQSVRQLALWDAREDGPHLRFLSVNLSARQLDDPETIDMVRGLLTRHRVDPSRVAIEVTESVVMVDSESTRRSLQGLKDLGVGVAIDDFGTGYSSLAYLHTLPVTSVKVDRSFVERLDGPDDSAPVVRAIVEMSHAMGLSVVAEGVKDEKLRRLVSMIGCDLAQGYVWAKPMPATEFAEWWRERDSRTP
jgi:diguanylate cyclase (GGDEF)-like protein/PAS domain S-box-containing protein